MNRPFTLLAGLALSALFTVGATSSGCASRATLTPSHGLAYRSAFAQQTANPTPRQADPNAIQGLDSQEAMAVSQSYRKSIGPKEGGEAAANQPMVLVNPAPHTQPNLPPPSVPSSNSR